MVKVSVVVPVYNASRYLHECIDSLLAQTLTDFELICVDDGSTDGSVSILDEYARKDDRVKVLRQDNAGAGVARNSGMAVATGEYLLFLDADDEFVPEMLEKLYLKGHLTDADIVMCRYQINECDKGICRSPTGVSFPEIDPSVEYPFRNDPELPFQAYAPAPWNKLFRADMVMREGLFFQNLASSNDICFTTVAKICAKRVVTIRDELVYYRTGHGGNIQSKLGKDPTCIVKALSGIWMSICERGMEDMLATKAAAFVLPNLMHTVNKLCGDSAALSPFYRELSGSNLIGMIRNRSIVVNLKNMRSLYLFRYADENSVLRLLSAGSRPKVSILIPVYNQERYISAALMSASSQTLKDIEILCVDDGSSDGSLRIMEEHSRQDVRIKVLRHLRNEGLVQARKTLTAAATGEYLLFLDPDDTLPSDAGEKGFALAKAHGADIVQGCFHLENVNNLPASRLAWAENINRWSNGRAVDGKGILPEAFLSGRIGTNLCGKLIDRELACNAYSEIPEARLVMAEDALACFPLFGYARRCYLTRNVFYNYRYGTGITGRDFLTLDDYKRQCEEVRMLPLLDAVIGDRPDRFGRCLECRNRLRERIYNSAYGRAVNFLTNDADRREGLRYLCELVGSRNFVTYLAERYFNNRAEPIQLLSRIEFVPRMQLRGVRRIGIMYFHLTLGGIQRVLVLLAPIFRRMGYEVCFILEKEVSSKDFPLPEGTTVRYLPESMKCTAGNIGRRIVALEEIIREERIDLVYYHPYSSNVLQWDLLTTKLVCGIPFMVHFHNSATCCLASATATTSEFSYLADKMRMSDTVIALSRIDELFFKSRGVNVRYLPNPVDPELARLPDGSRPFHSGLKRILWCARISWEKHPTQAIRVFAAVHRRMPDTVLTVVGGGAQSILDAMHELAETEGVADSVEFVGACLSAYPYYGKSDLFLMTSEFEGFPMTLVEAGAYGLPTVMYDIPYLEAVRNNAGVVTVPQGSVPDAAAAICAILSDERRYVEMSAANRRRIREFADFDHAGVWKRILEGDTSEQTSVEVKLDDVGILIRAVESNFAYGYDGRMKRMQSLEKDHNVLSEKCRSLMNASTVKTANAPAVGQPAGGVGILFLVKLLAPYGLIKVWMRQRYSLEIEFPDTSGSPSRRLLKSVVKGVLPFWMVAEFRRRRYGETVRDIFRGIRRG